METILVTDSLFVFPEHEQKLQAAGYEVRRIDKPKASDAELVEGLKGAVGYILGGIERVSASLIQSAPELRAIAFTGSGFEEFIPGHAEATRRGIPIAAAQGGNKEAVAEFTLALILAMLRDIPSLMPPGEVSFRTTRSAEDTTVGILGFGRIGARVAELCCALGFKVIATSRRQNLSTKPNTIQLVSKDELVGRSDILSIHVSKPHGTHALSESDIRSLRPGTILINAAFPDAVDQNILVTRLRAGEVKAAFDAPLERDTSDIPHTSLIQSNMQTAFNTHAANMRISDWVTRAIIAMLGGRDDPLIINPEYKQRAMR